MADDRNPADLTKRNNDARKKEIQTLRDRLVFVKDDVRKLKGIIKKMLKTKILIVDDENKLRRLSLFEHLKEE